MSRVINIKDIINIDNFQKIQNDIAKATGVAIIATDYKGKPITKHSSCTEFCKIIRSKENLKELCEKCDSRGGLEAARTGKPYIYKCHKGLIDFAIPIIIEDQYLGSIMSGQVLTEDTGDLELENIVQCDSNIESDIRLLKAYEDLNFIPLDKIKSIADMMFHIANYIIEEGNLKIVQEQIRKNTDNIIKSKENEVEIERELNKLLQKQLKSKTNENFIFDVLNSICSLALIEEAHKTRNTTCKLSKMIRYTLEKSNKIVSMEEEMNYIRCYLELSKVRLGERLEFDINIEDKYKNLKIPFMSIYPFVENSIVHAIKRKEEAGYIKILVGEEENWINILVIDNGVGINEEKLKLINKEDNNMRFQVNGINSSKKRMNRFYGHNYSINLKSKENKGTTVIIKLLKEDI